MGLGLPSPLTGNSFLKLNVKILPIVSPTWEGNIYMVSNKQIYLTPAVKNFREFILHHLLMQSDADAPDGM